MKRPSKSVVDGGTSSVTKMKGNEKMMEIELETEQDGKYQCTLSILQ